MELSLDVDGLPIIIADTAGIRSTDNLVERIGIQRARAAYAYCSTGIFFADISC
jgi:tRNA modification GTPase